MSRPAQAKNGVVLATEKKVASPLVSPARPRRLGHVMLYYITFLLSYLIYYGILYYNMNMCVYIYIYI